jgi:hypothetical protein
MATDNAKDVNIAISSYMMAAAGRNVRLRWCSRLRGCLRNMVFSTENVKLVVCRTSGLNGRKPQIDFNPQSMILSTIYVTQTCAG